MPRRPESHKGENGRVIVIGGSATMHGAPLFSALAAEASGVDLLHVALPRCHADVAKQASLNFQVHLFAGDEIAPGDVQALLELLATADTAVLGPGLARTAAAQKAMRRLIEGAPCPLVLDASALQPWTQQACAGRGAVLTPHLGELERLGIDPDEVDAAAADTGAVIHVKGPVDRIVSPDGSARAVEGGNAGLTVGGTGDALAGLIAGLMAQGMPPADACERASCVIKRAGALLFEQAGYAYTARQAIERIPEILREMGV